MVDDHGLDDLERWAAEARAREAADARVRERWLRTQAEEGGRLGLVLAGLAERRADVLLTTVAGRAIAGRLLAVGQDFVAITPGSHDVRATPAGHGVRATQAGSAVPATQGYHDVRAPQAGEGLGVT